MKDAPLLVIRTVKVEVYSHTIPGKGVLRWDVDRAKEQVKAGFLHQPQPVSIPRSEIEQMMSRCEWNEAHVEEVDHTIPGIAVPFRWEGAIIYVPIDGIHRAVKAYRLGLTFCYWLLTDEAARACFMDGPREFIP